MKGYNKNRQKFNVQLSDGTNNISFEKMWALNQASKSPGFVSNPLAKAYTPSFGLGGVLQKLAPVAAAIPGVGTLGAAAIGAAGGLAGMLDRPTAANPSVGYANRNPYGMASGGSMEQISPNSVEVTGAPGQTDGNQINYKGQPVNVDHGEVIDHSQDIVFSDKLFDPRSGKSFADTVKPMEKLIGKLSKTPSNINNNTIKALEQQKQKVFQTQEQVATALGQRNSDGSTVQGGQPAMASGGRMNYASGGYPDLTNLFLGKPFAAAKQYASNQRSAELLANFTEPYVEETPKNRRQYKYAKGYEKYRDLDLNPDDVDKQAEAFFASEVGKAYVRRERAVDPKWNFWGKNEKANSTIGPKYAALLADPGFQKILQTPYNDPTTKTTRLGQQFGEDPSVINQDTFGYNVIRPATNKRTVPDYAANAKNTYDAEIEAKRLAGTTADDSEENKRPGSEPFDAAGNINKFFKENPNPASIKKPSKYGIGDYLQLGAAGASVLGALFDRPERQKPNLDKTQITQNRYDPANALMQNQYTTNAGMMANANNYSSAGVQAGLQNLMANKYKADAQVSTQYDQMNQQARTQYEQRLQQQNQFNAQTLSANDDKNVANRAAYTNNLYGALHTVSNVGKGFNQRATSEKAIKALIANDPQAAQGFLDPVTGQVDQAAIQKNNELRRQVYQTIEGDLLYQDGTKYKKPGANWSGGKIKLRRRK